MRGTSPRYTGNRPARKAVKIKLISCQFSVNRLNKKDQRNHAIAMPANDDISTAKDEGDVFGPKGDVLRLTPANRGRMLYVSTCYQGAVMFGKVFASMYDGTLATKGPWQALVTFQQFIVLADRTGIVDMTAEAIARRTTIPIDIINIGITALEQADPESRSPDLDGRRIARLDDNRAWGWQIVNFEKYRKIRSEDERREYMANLMRERRKKLKAENPDSKHALAKLANADADATVNVSKPAKKHITMHVHADQVNVKGK